MKVQPLAHGRKYDVWALCEDDGTCPMLEALRETSMEHPDLVEAITAHLYEIVPDQGPILDGYRGKMLYRDVLFELRESKNVQRRLIGLRIAFFFDCDYDRPVIVCTNAFCKLGSSTPEADLTKAQSLRAEYYQRKSELEFVTERGL